MNERIREFEKLSGLEVYGLGARREYWDRCTKKFTELIVAEMLQICEDHPGWSARMVGEQIKQHFGVKE